MARAADRAPAGRRRGRKAPPPPPPPKPWWRRHRRAVSTVVLAVAILFGLRLFVVPATDPVDRADAVVVMPGSGEGGLTAALALVNGEHVTTLVVPGGAEGGAAAERLCAGDAPVAVFCPAAAPDARQQAAALGTLIAEQGWGRVVVVSARARSSRDALLMGRCTDAVVLRQLAGGQGAAAAAVSSLPELPRYLQALFFRQRC